MIERILVPLDGSRMSESILGPVLSLVKATGATLTLLHTVTPSEYFSVTAAQYVRIDRQRSAEYLKELGVRLAREGAGIRERVTTGEASREIVAEALRARADLIAMSSHGRSGIREWPFGSVTERVLKTAQTPVLMLREGEFWGPMIRKIVVAFDGSEESMEVLPTVLDVASATGAAVTLVHAGKRPPPSLPVAEKLLRTRHIPFDAKLVNGEAAQAVLKAIQEEHADLAALSTTGKTSGDLAGFGSVADAILRRCDRPLLVQRTGRIS